MDSPFAGVNAATERAILEVLRTLAAEGRTVICVHHDLQTVADYFAHVLMLNVTRIADGPVATTLTPETNQQTYRGRVHALDFGFAAAWRGEAARRVRRGGVRPGGPGRRDLRSAE